MEYLEAFAEIVPYLYLTRVQASLALLLLLGLIGSVFSATILRRLTGGRVRRPYVHLTRSASVFVLVASAGGLGFTVLTVPEPVDVDGIVDGLLERYEERVGEVEAREAERLGQREQLTTAVRSLAESRKRPDAHPGIDEALERLAIGDTLPAERILKEVVERKEAEGSKALSRAAETGAKPAIGDHVSKMFEVRRQAAAAARGLGALAFLRDAEESLRAYESAIRNDQWDPVGWHRYGHLTLRLGFLDAAAGAYGELLEIAEERKDQELIAIAHGGLGVIHWSKGDLAKAEEHHRKALDHYKELDNMEGMAEQYGDLGVVLVERDELDGAYDAFYRARAYHEELGNTRGMASSYGNLGVVHMERGEIDKAELRYRMSLLLHEEVGDKRGMAVQHGNLGIVYQMRGELEKAEESQLKALALREELGDDLGVAIQYSILGVIRAKRGRLSEACDLWRVADRVFREIGAGDRRRQVASWAEGAGCPGPESAE